MDQHKEYQLWMQQLPAVGERRIKKLLSRFGSEREAYERLKTAGEQTVGELLSGILNKEQAECVRMFTRKWQLKENYERLREQEISFLTEEDGAYPERLRQMEIPPYGLYVKGKLPEGERAWAAVIGARECSSYGSFLAQAFGRRLGEAGEGEWTAQPSGPPLKGEERPLGFWEAEWMCAILPATGNCMKGS